MQLAQSGGALSGAVPLSRTGSASRASSTKDQFGVALPVTPCGGTERWPVKTGTDDDASRVDLGTVDDRHTILALNQAERPPELPNSASANSPYETKRTDDGGLSELAVYRIKGWLKFWKYEKASQPNASPDGDFHVVIVDQAASSFAHAGDDPTGTSLVVEFPSKLCVAGRRDQYSDRGASHFIETGAAANALDMAAARGQFETLMSQILKAHPAGCSVNKCELTTRSAVPVYVTGVGFFDFPHGQIGRASNTFELHPVLAIYKRTVRGS
jgi:hypothetical protein